MSKEPKRILHITEMLSAAGIESFIMNVYRNIDRTQVQFDFLVLRDEKEFYDDEIASLGGKKYFVHSNIRNTLLRVIDESRQIERFLKNNHYDIVHIHYTTPLRAFYLKAAKNANVPVRIYHSHSAEVSGKSRIKIAIYNYCKKVIDKYATHYFACSQAAANWIYSKKTIDSNQVKIIYNGIDTKRFTFDEAIRNNIRKELGINDEFVIINTGRFTEQKNQSFIFDIVDYIRNNINKEVRLLLLGEGPLKDEYEIKANRLGIAENVIFLGVRKNVQDFLFASDCFIMPSLYEGLPVAGIEAECTGLPCVFSSSITKEVSVNELCVFVDLSGGIVEWSRSVIGFDKKFGRDEAAKKVKEAGYDIKDVAKNMEHFYLNFR